MSACACFQLIQSKYVHRVLKFGTIVGKGCNFEMGAWEQMDRGIESGQGVHMYIGGSF
jgi:hypothetical protein